MIPNSFEQIRRSSVVNEEDALAHTPKRSCSELVRTSVALDDFIREFGTHVMNEQVRIRIGPTLIHGEDLLSRFGRLVGC